MTARFGAVLPSSMGSDVPDPNELWRFAETAESLEMSHLWVSDHVLFWHPMYEAVSLLAALAAKTTNIRIGTAVLLLALRNPVIAAKSLATIDRLSLGRLTVGIGIGGEFPPEWEAVGVDHRTRVSRTDEMIEALTGLWQAGAFSYSGRRISIPEIDLPPKPSQSPLPVWVGGRSMASVKRAASKGQGWMGIFLTPERYATRVAELEEQAELQQREPETLTRALYVWTCIADDDKTAREMSRGVLAGFYNTDFEKLERFAIIGSPETCAARFEEFAAAGVEEFAIAPISPPIETLQRLSAEVIPKLRN